jgi:hypothetical protein
MAALQEMAPAEYQHEVPTEVQLAQAARRGGHLALVAQVEHATEQPVNPARHIYDRPVVKEIPRQYFMEASGGSAW